MQTENPHLTEAQARHLTIHGSTQNEDGTFSWKFDNYVRAFAPVSLPQEEQYALYRRISCPTLLFRGTESWAADPETDGPRQVPCRTRTSPTSRVPDTGCTTTNWTNSLRSPAPFSASDLARAKNPDRRCSSVWVRRDSRPAHGG